MNGVDLRPTFDRVKGVIIDQLDVHDDDVKPSASLAEDLAVDSLDRIELTMGLEEEFGVEITDDEGSACNTVGDIVTLIDGKAK